jgi:hypothetical protein
MLLPTIFAFSGILTSSASDPSSSCSVPEQNVLAMITHGPDSGSWSGLSYTHLSFPTDQAQPTDMYQVLWIPPPNYSQVYNWSQVKSGEDEVVPFPEDVVEELANMPGVVSQVPGIGTCLPGLLFGAPTAKIVVSELTASSTTTISMAGNYGDSGTSATLTPVTGISSPQSDTSPTTTDQVPNGSGTSSETTKVGASPSGPVSTKSSAAGGSGIGISKTTSSTAPSSVTAIVSNSALTTGIAGFVGASQTLVAGGKPIIVSGTTYSLASSGNAIVVNGVTSTLPSLATGSPLLTIGTQTYTYNPSVSSAVVINGQTLVPGGPAITVSGNTLSLPISGTDIVVASSGKTTSEGLGSLIISGLEGPTGSQTGIPAPLVSNAGKSMEVPWIGICVGALLALW